MNRLAKYNSEKLNEKLWNLRNSIIAEIAPKLSMARRAAMAGERLEMDAIELSRPGRPVGTTGGQTRTQKHNSHLAKYQFVFGCIAETSKPDNGNGMEENNFFYSVGTALAERDAAKV